MPNSPEKRRWLNLENDKLLKIREQLESTRKDYNDRIWETIKFFTTMFSGLTAIFVLLEYIPDITKSNLLVKLGWLSVPMAALSISVIGFANLRREYFRSMETISMIMKVDTQLKFYDKGFIPQSEIDRGQYDIWKESEEKWLQDRMQIKWRDFMKSKASAYTVFSILYIVYIAISVFLLLVGIYFGLS